MTKEDIIKPENLVYQKPRLLNDNPMHYCPGCSHGVVHKLIAEVIDEMGMAEKAVGVSPVGCAVFMYNYLDIDCQEAAHGRAPALATAIKRLWPDREAALNARRREPNKPKRNTPNACEASTSSSPASSIGKIPL